MKEMYPLVFIMVFVVSFSFGWSNGYRYATNAERERAIKHGAGQYVTDPLTKKQRFVYLEGFTERDTDR